MTMIKNTSGQFPHRMTGTIVFTGAVTGTFAVGETVTGTGFSAKVIKWKAATKELTVKNIVGNPTAADTITGGTSSASAAVDTITSTTVGGVEVKTGGWNLRETKHGITRSKKQGTRTTVEVLIADRGLAAVRTDFATVATFTLTGGAWSAGTTYDVSAGDVITLTIVSSEPTKLPSGTTYAITVGGVSRTATLSSSASNNLSHTFSYPVVAGDIGTGLTVSVTTGNFNLNGGTAYELADNGVQKALTAPVAVAGSLANKTGVTVQA